MIDEADDKKDASQVVEVGKDGVLTGMTTKEETIKRAFAEYRWNQALWVAHSSVCSKCTDLQTGAVRQPCEIALFHTDEITRAQRIIDGLSSPSVVSVSDEANAYSKPLAIR